MLKNLFQSGMKSPSPFDPTTQTFLQLNVENLAKSLKLDEMGRERGSKNLPQPDDVNLDDIELSIQSELCKVAGAAYRDTAEFLHTFRERIMVIDLADAADRAGTIAKQTDNTLYREARDGTTRLFNAKRDIVDAETSLNQFKKDHKLDRPAYYPGNRFNAISVIAFIAALEILLNGVLLGDANEFGYVGGVIQAILITIINVALGVVIGALILPWIHHNASKIKRTGAVLLVVGVFTVICFNLFVGHYRDALEMWKQTPDIASVGENAVDLAKMAFFSLNNFKSWIFVFIGYITVFVTAWKTFRMDDPFPDYGRRDRQHKLLSRSYGSVLEVLHKRIENIASDGQNQIDELVDNVQLHRAEVATIQQKAKNLINQLKSYYSSVEAVGQQLFQKYHYANREERKDSYPKYWSKPFKLENDCKLMPVFEKPEMLDLELLLQCASKTRKSIAESIRGYLAVYKTIDQLTAEAIEKFRLGTLIEMTDEVKSKTRDSIVDTLDDSISDEQRELFDPIESAASSENKEWRT